MPVKLIDEFSVLPQLSDERSIIAATAGQNADACTDIAPENRIVLPCLRFELRMPELQSLLDVFKCKHELTFTPK